MQKKCGKYKCILRERFWINANLLCFWPHCGVVYIRSHLFSLYFVTNRMLINMLYLLSIIDLKKHLAYKLCPFFNWNKFSNHKYQKLHCQSLHQVHSIGYWNELIFSLRIRRTQKCVSLNSQNVKVGFGFLKRQSCTKQFSSIAALNIGTS